MIDMTVTTDPSLTVAIISDQHLVWLGMQKILESKNTIQVVGQPQQRSASQAVLAQHRPDVVILDTDTERDVITSIQQIREAVPESKVVVLSGLEDKNRMREAVEYGVEGVILKIHPPTVVLAIIAGLYLSSDTRTHIGANGTPPVDPQNLAPIQPHHDRQAITVWPSDLTERERAVIRLVKQGLSNKDIAYQLSISDSTVRHHLTSIFDKVGVPNRQKLMVHAHHFRSSPI